MNLEPQAYRESLQKYITDVKQVIDTYFDEGPHLKWLGIQQNAAQVAGEVEIIFWADLLA